MTDLMMENKCERRISDIPPEVALHICKHIEDRDILNAVEAIPTWNWIASPTWLKAHLSRRISQWPWIDRHIYTCLFPQPSTHFYRNPRGVFQYRFKQDDLHANNVQTSTNLANAATIRYLVYPPTGDDIQLDFEQTPVHSNNAQSPLLERITDEDIDETDDGPLQTKEIPLTILYI